MSEKKIATIVVPDDVTEISVSAVKLCELFIVKLIETIDLGVEIMIDQKNNLVTSNDKSIKDLLSMYLKSRQFELFYNQLISLTSRTVLPNEVELKVLAGEKIFIISVRELNALPNLHLSINMAKLDIEKWELLE